MTPDQESGACGFCGSHYEDAEAESCEMCLPMRAAALADVAPPAAWLALSRLEADWLAGRTATGRTVRIPEDPYATDCPIYVDDQKVELVPPPRGLGSIQRRRDGGTTIIYTTAGVIYRPTPFAPNLKPTLDGEPLNA